MSNERKRVRGAFAASILLAASLASAPAIAKKPPPPPTEDPGDPDDPWYGCTPWGAVIYGVDCCDYPELVIPCLGPNPPFPPVIYDPEEISESAGD
ncbi:MAG: hypothetical protein WBR13_08800 [Allosphingosinicella sp.]